MKRIILGLCLGLLSACTTNTEPSAESDGKEQYKDFPAARVVASLEDLPFCNDAIDGFLFYITERDQFFVCEDKQLEQIAIALDSNGEVQTGDAGKDGTSCSAATIEEGIELKCGEVVVDTLTNGQNGTSCNALVIEEGIEVSCGDLVVDTLKNGLDGENGVDGQDGTNGQNGIDGEDGKSCEANSIAAGVEVLCDGVVVDTLLHGVDGTNGVDGQDGAIGPTGATGADGVDGTNGTDGTNGSDGQDGVGINWLGDSNGLPASPSKNDAFYWPTLNTSCIYDGSAWKVLSAGANLTSTKCENFGPKDVKGVMIDTRDKKQYSWVLIGDYKVMAENLNYSNVGACYGGDDANCAEYGRLYTWSEALNISAVYDSTSYSTSASTQGICPENWIIPSKSDWDGLMDYVFTEQSTSWENAAEFLKGVNSWGTNPGVDTYGLNLTPGGNLAPDGGSWNKGSAGIYWLLDQEESDVKQAERFYVNKNNQELLQNAQNKKDGQALRCIQKING